MNRNEMSNQPIEATIRVVELGQVSRATLVEPELHLAHPDLSDKALEFRGKKDCL